MTNLQKPDADLSQFPSVRKRNGQCLSECKETKVNIDCPERLTFSVFDDVDGTVTRVGMLAIETISIDFWKKKHVD